MTDPTQNQPPHDTTTAEASWTAALTEQAESTVTDAAGEASAVNLAQATLDAQQTRATAAVFPPLVDQSTETETDIDMIMDIPVQLSVELGRTRLTIKNILQLGQGSVVELDGLAGEPMDIYVNGYLIAQGEVVAVDEKYGIRVTDIITPADRIQRLHSRR